MDRQIVGDAAAHYHKLMAGKRAIAFHVSIKRSQESAEQFRAAGIPSAHIDGETPDAERVRVIRDFADGRLLVLHNVELVTTGFDLSAQVGRDVPVEAGIMLRPTQSLTLWFQMFGRVLRRKPYPAIVTDHAGNALVHGLPDMEIEWSLDGKPKRAAPIGGALRACDECFAVFPAHLRGCPRCGKAPAPAAREGPEQVAGELKELSPEQLRRRKEEATAMKRGLEELVRLTMDRGYKAGWAAMRWALRQNHGRKPSPQQLASARKDVDAMVDRINRQNPPQQRSA
jgi:DNA repair protein RadD